MSRPKVHREPRVSTALRIPAPLYDAVRQEAADRDVSANWLIIRFIEEGMTRLVPVADMFTRTPRGEG